MEPSHEPTERTRVRRKPSRGSYEREVIDEILDRALICHVGFVDDGQPYVTPTIHARHGDTLYLHGSPSSRTLTALAGGAPCCITATLVDELVLARSARQHSLNYRSVMVLGNAREVTDPDEKQLAMRAVVDHIVPGRSDHVRGPDEKEAETTRIVALPIDEASAKLREGPPVDKREDHELPFWAGRLPLTVAPGTPIPEPELHGAEIPDHVRNWRRDSTV